MEILHLSKKNVIEFNRRIVEMKLDEGDFFHVRDDATLDYIIYRHHKAKTLEEKAAELLVGVARNQIFANGNKRTAFQSTQIFLFLNSIKLNFSQEFSTEELEEIVLNVANDRMNKSEVVLWLRELLKK